MGLFINYKDMASIKIIQKSKALSNGEYPIYLQIIKYGKVKRISLNLSCPKDEWDGNEFKRNHPNYIKRNRLLNKFKERAYAVIDEFAVNGIDFTLSEFENKFRNKRKGNATTVLEFWDERINDLRKSHKTGNARAYKDVKNSFFKFNKNKNILFRDITPKLLDKYEVYLRNRENTDGGISLKMRTIRALYNYAIKMGEANAQNYPFRVYKISKLKGKNVKRALTVSEFKKFEALDLNKYPHLTDTKYMFLFSFYLRGINYVDMMKLEWKNIEDGKVYYKRSKTGKIFIIKILEPVQKILDYYKAQNRDTPYVFPILGKVGLEPMQIEYRKDKMLKVFNRELKEIASIQGINKNITSYVARHSYATIMKYKGIRTDVISESMGHANLDVTNSYLKEFENDIIDDANEKLLDL